MATPKITNEEEDRAVVKNAVRALIYVPEKHKTQEQYLEAVKNFAKVYGEKLMTRELFFAALDNIGEALEAFPESMRGEIDRIFESARQYAAPAPIAKALEAVKEGAALEDVPEHLMTAEICLEAVKTDACALNAVPDKLMTAELCLEAVKNYGDALMFVPDKLRTAELCLEAVMQDGSALEYVPENLKTPELCLEAVKTWGYAFDDVPENLITAEFCLEAVKNDGFALGNVPENHKTAELCIEGMKSICRKGLEMLVSEPLRDEVRRALKSGA